MYAYCLFCQTQKCRYIARALEKRGVLRAFSPQIIKRQRVQGKNIERLYDLLPGYVFVYAEEKLQDFSIFYGMDGLIRRLGTPETYYLLTDGDYDFAMRLYQKNGLIGQMAVYKIGDTVRLEEPLFAGCEGRITRIDYKKQRARVDYHFAGMSCYTWIACELINAADPRDGDSLTADQAK